MQIPDGIIGDQSKLSLRRWEHRKIQSPPPLNSRLDSSLRQRSARFGTTFIGHSFHVVIYIHPRGWRSLYILAQLQDGKDVWKTPPVLHQPVEWNRYRFTFLHALDRVWIETVYRFRTFELLTLRKELPLFHTAPPPSSGGESMSIADSVAITSATTSFMVACSLCSNRSTVLASVAF